MSSGMETHTSVSYVLQRALSARALKKRQGHGPSERAVVGRIVSMCGCTKEGCNFVVERVAYLSV